MEDSIVGTLSTGSDQEHQFDSDPRPMQAPLLLCLEGRSTIVEDWVEEVRTSGSSVGAVVGDPTW